VGSNPANADPGPSQGAKRPVKTPWDTSVARLPEIASLRRNHAWLMRSYVIALSRLSYWEFGSAERRTVDRDGFNTGQEILLMMAENAAARRLAHSHVRRRLKRISGLYSQLLPAVVITRDADWLRIARDDMNEFRSSLQSLRLPSAVAVIPVGITFGGRYWDVLSARDFVIALISLILLFAAFALVVLSGGFKGKRAAFLESGVSGRTVYDLEADLFDLVNRNRSGEVQIDQAVESLLCWIPFPIAAIVTSVYDLSAAADLLLWFGALGLWTVLLWYHFHRWERKRPPAGQ